MCGITGIISNQARDFSETIAAMTNTLAHRGPDDSGYIALNPGNFNDKPAQKIPPHEKASIFLGHRRLSIIDIKGTKQPLRNEDGSVWTVFNGEIYNYKQIGSLLKAKGHKLQEKGDTEVLVHLWEEYGENMLEHLIGMFAFAIYDIKQNTLFLARDRFGEKPLFYWNNSDFFAFASELQALWKIDRFPANDINNIAVAQYFRYGYIPSPRTIYKDVFSLQPGHCAKFEMRNSKFEIKQYWRPVVTGEKKNIDLEELWHRFDESVKLRLVSDVPLGIFLSGGIDSSLITASVKNQSTEPVRTFTISTGEYWCDESKEAELIAKYLKTDHNLFLVKPDFINISGMLARHYGQPYADYSAVPTYYISKETRKYVKVALGGDGGDELFAGYNRYANFKWNSFAAGIPYSLRLILAGFAKFIPFNPNFSRHVPDFILSACKGWVKGENPSSTFHRYWQKQGFREDFVKTLTDSDEDEINLFQKYYREAPSLNPLEKLLEVDQRMYLCDNILIKVDIASMAVSLECRAPFLDHNFSEFVNKISINAKLHKGQTKYILRKLAETRLPKKILKLPKKGFTLPLSQWLRKELKEWAYFSIFKNEKCWTDYLKEDTIRHFWDEHQSGRIDHSMRLWMTIAFGQWRKSLNNNVSL